MARALVHSNALVRVAVVVLGLVWGAVTADDTDGEPVDLVAAALLTAEEAALGSDDECLTLGDGQCGLSLRQLRGERRQQQKLEAADVVKVQAEVGRQNSSDTAPPEESEVDNDTDSGACNSCMEGHPEVDASASGVGGIVGSVSGPLEGSLGAGGYYHPGNYQLMQSSNAPLYTFYVYRAASSSDYPMSNVNAANLVGVMWYLHNEVVKWTPRKFHIVRIKRYKVQTRAPQPLFNQGINFGIRYAFDSGQCTGPWSCQDVYQKYGYVVGCNRFEDRFPFPDKESYYPGGIWYSFPGQCSSRKYYQQDQVCKWSDPGGMCQGTPTGRGDCTYSYQEAGEISLDELEGISNYHEFTRQGKKEYNVWADAGVGLHFWDHFTNPAENLKRVQAARDLFARKYPNDVDNDVAPAPCDFNFDKFFPQGSPDGKAGPPGSTVTAAPRKDPVQHWAQNCWYRCGAKSGSCSWCGQGNACCRYGSQWDPPECSGIRVWPTYSYHTCVSPR
mmetsp:Transcript_114939/g.245421  ORF Transcript_114939/g.245421 Transcript_114939/m.245421 type:complete len:502 (-) Transcript_114939:61-1566(-)